MFRCSSLQFFRATSIFHQSGRVKTIKLIFHRGPFHTRINPIGNDRLHQRRYFASATPENKRKPAKKPPIDITSTTATNSIQSKIDGRRTRRTDDNVQVPPIFPKIADEPPPHEQPHQPQQQRHNAKFDARVPKLFYFHSPIRYFKTKLKFWKLKSSWDWDFTERDFIAGSKKAAVVLTNLIRCQDFETVAQFTTPLGYHQISRDMLLSKADPRLQMIQFRMSDIKRAIPIKIVLFEQLGFRHCLIDMFFVGMRNINDFETVPSGASMQKLLEQYKSTYVKNTQVSLNLENDDKRKIIFAEIFMRFYRDYTNTDFLDDWNVSFYKVLNFNVLSISK